jgi:hypothetical protein
MNANTETLSKMNAARSAALGDMSPAERGQKKVLDCLLWIYKWGWSTSEILRNVSGAAQPIVPRMLAAGLVKQTELFNAGLLGRPRYSISLSRDGLARAQAQTDRIYNYTNHVRKNQIDHDLFAQKVTLSYIKKGTFGDFTTARMLEGIEGRGDKIPDVVGVFKRQGGTTEIVIEVELEQKTGDKFAIFAGRLIRYIEKQNNRIVVIATDSGAIQKNYASRFAEGSTLRLAGAAGRGQVRPAFSERNVDALLARRIFVVKL